MSPKPSSERPACPASAGSRITTFQVIAFGFIGLILTHQYILRQVWGTAPESNAASLRVFMATLRKKLEVSAEAPVFIQTHVGIGYRMMKISE